MSTVFITFLSMFPTIPIIASPTWSNPSINCPNDTLERYSVALLGCLSEDKIPHYTHWDECYTVNSKESCDSSIQRLVIDDSCPPFTKCQEVSGEVVGATCDEGRIRRFGEDIFGKVSCMCSPLMGYLEWEDGECYHEYMQGPCKEGEQIRQTSILEPPVCQPHNCSKGEVLWEDGLCYTLEAESNCAHMYDLEPKQSNISDTKKLDCTYPNCPPLPSLLTVSCMDFNPLGAGTFDNCIVESRGGRCLKTKRKVNRFKSGDLKKILMEMYLGLLGKTES